MSDFDEYEAYTDQQLLKFIIKELIAIKEILKARKNNDGN